MRLNGGEGHEEGRGFGGYLHDDDDYDGYDVVGYAYRYVFGR